MEFPTQLTVDRDRILRLVQVTDCHLGAEPGEQLLGLDTDESLVDVLQHLTQMEEALDLVAVTGDIASGGCLPAYQRFLQIASRYLDSPMAWLPGNHDEAATMEQVLRQHTGNPLASVVEMGNWQVIMLDSSVPGEEYGDLSAEQLELLRDALSQRTNHHALVFLHHQPVPVGSAWIDQYIVRSADAFFDLIDSFPQVKGVCWGHVHQAFEAERKGIKLWATPSSCVQFKPGIDEFTVDRLMPGYRWFNLHPDGQINSGISRIPEKTYSIDYNSAGY